VYEIEIKAFAICLRQKNEFKLLGLKNDIFFIPDLFG
jgi:hypothetical protein